MSIVSKYFETEAGQVRPSKSIRTLARISYWCYLILGAVAAVVCLIGFIGNLFHKYTMDMAFVYLLLSVIIPLFCKLLGWMSSLSLRAIEVVVESHEKNLGLQVKPESVTVKLATWTCKSCGSENPKNIGSCAKCGNMKEDRTEAMQAAIAEKLNAAKKKATEVTERIIVKPKSAPTRRSGSWTCPQCNTENPAFVGSCNQCGAMKGKAATVTEKIITKPKKEATSKSDGWICAQCGASNPAFVGSCNQCGAVKPKR